jgi:hypothetical protein
MDADVERKTPVPFRRDRNGGSPAADQTAPQPV